MKLPCREFIAMIEDYIDASLTDERREVCDHHLSDCPYCRDYLHTYRDAMEVMKRTLSDNEDLDVEVSDDLVVRLLDARRKNEQ